MYMEVTEASKTIEDLMRAHECWRANCINLIASENALSPGVKRWLSCDLVQRYGDYTGRDLQARKYRGNKYIAQIEQVVTDLAQRVFDAKYVELRPLSGHVAGAAVLLGLCRPGDTVLELSREAGGHRMATKLAEARLIDLNVEYWPFDPIRYNIDVGPAVDLMSAKQPRVALLGSSIFLFPHPVAELAKAAMSLPDTTVVYDASHVLGLVAGHHFQDPLREGAAMVFGSAHKTFPGPQGGIIFSNDDRVMDQVTTATYPGLVTNHHLARIPSMGIALSEILTSGEAYAAQTIANAQTLAREIHARGVDVVGSEYGYTDSHTLLLSVKRFGKGAEIARLLEEAAIIVTSTALPQEIGGDGIRIGVQEITRLGVTEGDMIELADLIAQAITGKRPPTEIALQAQEFGSRFRKVCFT
jgi:glycine hydroxymethyltransferase